MKNKILVTGGAGYIGSHTCIALHEAGYDIVVYDNLSNSSCEAINRVSILTGKPIEFIKGDIRDTEMLRQVFSSNYFFGVIHFAGLKSVGESVSKPLLYYNNNISGTINLLEVMAEYDVKNIVFSSSATVYGDPEKLPIDESSPRSCTNPYGQSKLAVEYILEDLAISDDNWNLISLRYFNPVGAHPSGKIGEDPNDIPNNLMPYISQVAVGKLDKLNIFGNDYSTVDGTGVRDFIHVSDLAQGHVAALNHLEQQTSLNKNRSVGFLPINLGTGRGTSVLELVNAFIQVTGQAIPYQFVGRRAGDVASCCASAYKAKVLLGWEAKLSITEMCQDTWNWQSNNPNGYRVKDI
ncbi:MULTISPECIES: UDP-glucose 4-epimerase GalE [Psychrobacter]|uniref:UDP-glucose 4-epimerase n=1 Tax=Psychrobacter alimentarius TaxID=261164 RepID=A0ABM5ZUQ8_9GAMM|nr:MULTISPECIES: UDP-glucose 4-epimerase GalE [Psychrobacter]AMT95772.1 UDP-glucose 4-epimerase [Psychrobacter alimentarius]QCB31801.1 UDP-glucose 4-epimerase GalE [Psychrobacter sp. PAMC27889]